MPHGIAAPCVVLDVRGYYDHLPAFLDHAVTAGFLRPGTTRCYPSLTIPRSCSTASPPPSVGKWLELEQA